jgi:hypothetical protein
MTASARVRGAAILAPSESRTRRACYFRFPGTERHGRLRPDVPSEVEWLKRAGTDRHLCPWPPERSIRLPRLARRTRWIRATPEAPACTITWNDVRRALARQRHWWGIWSTAIPRRPRRERTSEDLARSPGRCGDRAIMNRSNRTCRAARRRPPVSGGLLAGTVSSQPRQEAALRQ